MKDDNTEKTLGEGIFDKARRGGKSALRELKSLADNEDAEALSKLAEIYLKGLGEVEQSPQKAIELLKQAAAHDEPDYELLTYIYRKGVGDIKQSGQKLLEYLIKDYGENTADDVVDIYWHGCGEIKPDGRKAFECTFAHGFRNVLSNCYVLDENCGDIRRDGQKIYKQCEYVSFAYGKIYHTASARRKRTGR